MANSKLTADEGKIPHAAIASLRRFSRLGSPDLKPIEEAFSKIKVLVRRAEARTRAILIEAMCQALSAVTARDTHGFFGHYSYPKLGQLL